MFAGAIQQTQTPIGIESKHGDIRYAMIVRSQRSRFELRQGRCTRSVSPAN